VISVANSAKVSNDDSELKDKERKRPAIRYPAYDLAESVGVAKAIHEQGGGVASRDRLAAFLGYSTTNSGAFFGRLAAARLFGLITTRGSDFVITPVAQKILMPVQPEHAREALVEAWQNVPLFREMYDEHDRGGRPLPPEFGMKNLLRSKYGMDARQAADAYRALMDSAEVAGFFLTRNARTHLIIPQIAPPARTASPAVPGVEAPPAHGEAGGRGSGSGGGGIAPPARGQMTDDPTKTYLAAMIEVWREKSLKGDTDIELQERIEKWLEKTADKS
jgi:hypothetical protein